MFQQICASFLFLTFLAADEKDFAALQVTGAHSTEYQSTLTIIFSLPSVSLYTLCLVFCEISNKTPRSLSLYFLGKYTQVSRFTFLAAADQENLAAVQRSELALFKKKKTAPAEWVGECVAVVAGRRYYLSARLAATKQVWYLQRTATHCNMLQHAATHCNTLQHAATCCNTLQHAATCWSIRLV